MGPEKDRMDQFSLQRDRRASTHTVGSLASTVYTRASNIIQIAYIPGVTNRSHSTPDLIPPVPPVPAASSGASHMDAMGSPSSAEDEHFFLPSDLRNSTYSGYTDRTSMARNSVASELYRNNAVVNPLPALAATRAKAVPVSVRSTKPSPLISRSATSSTANSPSASPYPAQQSLSTKSSIVGRMAVPRAITVTRKNRQDQVYELEGSSASERSASPYTVAPDRKNGTASPYSHASSTFDDASSDDEATAHAAHRLIGRSRQSPIPTDTIMEEEDDGEELISPYYNRSSPYARPETNASFHTTTTTGSSLNQMIEEAARKASQIPVHNMGDFRKKQAEQQSPFADSNVARTP